MAEERSLKISDDLCFKNIHSEGSEVTPYLFVSFIFSCQKSGTTLTKSGNRQTGF